MADMAGVGGGAAAADPDGVDGVRMTWNNWPRTKVEASKCVVPIAIAISLIRPSPDLPLLPYPPLRCKPPCSAVLNPFCHVDFVAKIWICPFCLSRNNFPHNYVGISEINVPGELFPQYTTIEYALGAADPTAAPASSSPVFLFVLDTCIIEEELEFVKSALRRAIGLLPENAMVGMISYGSQVHVHELGFSDLAKLYVFRGTKEVSKEQILDQLGLSSGRRMARGAPAYAKEATANGVNPGASTVNRFLLPASDCEYTLNVLLDELQRDPWTVDAGNRALCCTGVALSVAAGLLGACSPGTGSRIIALVGGPCTVGPGMLRDVGQVEADL